MFDTSMGNKIFSKNFQKSIDIIHQMVYNYRQVRGNRVTKKGDKKSEERSWEIDRGANKRTA